MGKAAREFMKRDEERNREAYIEMGEVRLGSDSRSD